MDERQKDKSDLEMQVAMLEKEIADLKQQIKERRFLKGITFEDMMPEGEEKGTNASNEKTLKSGDEIAHGGVAAKPTMEEIGMTEYQSNQLLEIYENRMCEMEDEIKSLRERLAHGALMMHVYICKTGLKNAEKSNHYASLKRPEYIRVPLSVIRFAELVPIRMGEISTKSLNSIVSQIEEEIRDRMIISVEL